MNDCLRCIHIWIFFRFNNLNLRMNWYVAHCITRERCGAFTVIGKCAVMTRKKKKSNESICVLINKKANKVHTHLCKKKNKKHFGTINRYVYIWQMYIRFYTVSIQCQNDIMSLEYHFAASVTFFFYKLKWLWGIKTGIITIKKNSRFKHKRKKQGLGESESI